MKTITFEFPTPEIETQAIFELSEHFGYPLQVPGTPINNGTEEEPEWHTPQIDNPMSREDYCRQGIKALLGSIIKPRILAKQLAGARAALDSALGATVVS